VGIYNIGPTDLKNATVDVLKGKKYYSKAIKGYTNMPIKNSITIDDFDRQILYHLSMGEKTKNLSKHIPLSARAIEVRKLKLTSLLNIDNETPFNSLKEAKSMGLV